MNTEAKSNIINSLLFMESFLKIKTKNNEITSFKLNEPQKKLYEEIKRLYDSDKPIRLIILKARQMGFSTLTEGIIFHRTVTKENVNSMIIAHTEEATNNLFNMSKLFFEELPNSIKPMKRASNSKEIIFENPTKNYKLKKSSPGLRSKIKCATAGGKGVGRSDTLTNVHASEYAFWEGDKKSILNGILQAVPPNKNTLVIIESTANGYDDFKEMWDKAVNNENDFIPIFFPWYEMKEYRNKYDGFVLTDEEIKMKELYCLDLEQISWRRWCIKNNCGGDIKLFNQEYPTYPDDAFITTGSCIFDKENILKRLEELNLSKDFRQGEFEYTINNATISEIKWVDKEKGYIRIYEAPRLGAFYVIGGDTAGDGSDCFTGQVINAETGNQCATLLHRFDEDMYAGQMYCLGKYYNNALIGIESNFSSYPIKELERLGYSNQYVRETEDSYTHKVKKSFGFKTTSITRPVIIGELVKLARENINIINDDRTLREMLTFIRNQKGRAEAKSGAHDDLVMGLAIGIYIRGSSSNFKPEKTAAKDQWREDMWEDYNNADEMGKKYLEEKWGKECEL